MNGLKKIALLLIAALIFSGCSSKGEKYVAFYDGENLSYDEYLVYLYEQQRAFESAGGVDIWDTKFDGEAAFEVAKRNALDTMVFVLTSVKEKGGGYALSEDDKAYAVSYSDEYYSALSDGVKGKISYETVEKVMIDNILLEIILTGETGDIEFDQSEYDKYYAQGVETLTESGIDIEAAGDVIDQVLMEQYIYEQRLRAFSIEIDEIINSKTITRNSEVWDSVSYLE